MIWSQLVELLQNTAQSQWWQLIALETSKDQKPQDTVGLLLTTPWPWKCCPNLVGSKLTESSQASKPAESCWPGKAHRCYQPKIAITSWSSLHRCKSTLTRRATLQWVLEMLSMPCLGSSPTLKRHWRRCQSTVDAQPASETRELSVITKPSTHWPRYAFSKPWPTNHAKCQVSTERYQSTDECPETTNQCPNSKCRMKWKSKSTSNRKITFLMFLMHRTK